MADTGEILLIKMVKHPFIWMGAGIMIRNYNRHTSEAEFWKTIGGIALVAGIAHSFDEHSHGHTQAPSMTGILRQIFTSHADEEALL